MQAIGFIGYSNTGKTTLIEKLIPLLRARGLRVSAIKNAHHGFDMDRPGKDSYRYREAGAGQVLIATGLRWALLSETPLAPASLDELIGRLDPCDLVIIEGFKSEGQIPRIEVRRNANTEPPIFPPGQGWRYSNTNYVVLGLLIEKVSGQALSDYLTANILGPLQMSETSLPAGTQFPEPHARGYTEPLDGPGRPIDATDWSASSTWAAGGMVSTLTDLRAWLPALAGGSLISPQLQRQRLQDASGGGLGPGVGYGIGIMSAAGWIGHNGSVPGYQTVAVYLPERQIALALMINTDIPRPGVDSPDTALARAVTEVLTPDHVYGI